MANRKRETDAEKARREREERIALLKMKQGIIEESELIPENDHVEVQKPRGLSRLSNFFYRNKAYVIMGAFFVLVATLLIVQFVTREREDLYVLAVAFDEKSEMKWYVNDLERALEKYCPDFDGNGKIHVAVNFVDRTSNDAASQYDDSQIQKLSVEYINATAQLIIADEGFIDWVNGEGSDEDIDPLYFQRIFLDQTELCSEDMLYGNVGVRLNQTPLAKLARWDSCPDNVMLLVRNEFKVGMGGRKTDTRNRERALTVLRNIVDNNTSPET